MTAGAGPGAGRPGGAGGGGGGGHAGDAEGLLRALAGRRGESYERFLEGLPSVAPRGPRSPGGGGVLRAGGERGAAACEAFRGRRPGAEWEGADEEPMEAFEVDEGTTAFCLESPKAPKFGNWGGFHPDGEGGSGGEEPERRVSEAAEAEAPLPGRSEAGVGAADGSQRDSIEPFALDPNFDYDNLDLTPRFTLDVGNGGS